MTITLGETKTNPYCLFVFFSISLELEELSKSEFESVFISDPSHKVCQQQLRQLKEEFERYKVKTQALHKNKSFKELSEQIGNKEKLKLQNEDLEKQLQELKESNNIRELDQKKVITNLRDQLKLTEENYRLEKEEANTVYKQKLEDLERQVLNQRERTLALVAEKDAEIEMLRSRSPSASPSADTRSVFSYQRKFVEMTGVSQASMDLPESSEADAAVHQLLSKNSGVSEIFKIVSVISISSRPVGKGWATDVLASSLPPDHRFQRSNFMLTYELLNDYKC